jgi:hypothetical protein
VPSERYAVAGAAATKTLGLLPQAALIVSVSEAIVACVPFERDAVIGEAVSVSVLVPALPHVRLWRRLEASRDVFARIAVRDAEIAQELESYHRASWTGSRLPARARRGLC